MYVVTIFLITKVIYLNMSNIRYMAAKLVKNYFKKKIANKGSYVGFMPDSFKLFFSTIFTQHAVLDHSNMQLMHPIFYGSDDRKRFLNVVIDLKVRGRNFFYCNTYLHCSTYGLHDWHARVPIFGPLREVYDHDRNKYQNIVNSLPEYLRNLHEHFLSKFTMLRVYIHIKILLQLQLQQN